MSKLSILFGVILLLPLHAFMQGVIIPKDHNFTVNSGNAVFINSGYDLLVEADTTGTGSVIDMNSSNAISFSGGGEALVEMFLSEDDWHYISSPVTDATSGIFWDVYLKQFTESDSSWFFITNTDSVLHEMKGYAAWAESSLTGDTTITFPGNLNAGNYSRSLTNNGSASHNSKGFNFVGNPYPSAIDWQIGSEGWTRTNIDPTIYLWNPGEGQYGTYNRSTKVSTHSVDSIIPPKQGFFVHVTSNGAGSLTVKNEARLHNHKDFFKGDMVSDHKKLLRLKVNGNGFADETVIYFDNSASPGYDSEYDDFKLSGKSDAPQLFTRADNTRLAVNTLNTIEGNEIVNLYFKCDKPGTFILNAHNMESFEPEVPIYLEDTKDQYFQDLRENPEYDFFYTPVDPENRFRVHFSAPSNLNEISWQQQTHIYADDNEIIVNMPGSCEADIDLYSLLGQHIESIENPGSHYRIQVSSDKTFYLVVLTSPQGTMARKVFVF